jgi:ABC-type Fe3+/spermidine/putrescine transport system ATPase subunit
MLEAIGLCKRWLNEDAEDAAVIGSAASGQGPVAGARHLPPRWLAHHLSLSVAPGETVAVLGASGSGKSTLLKMLAGLETPEAGQVRWAGQDLTQQPPEKRGFALMFQDFALFPHLNVQDNVAFGPVEQGVPRQQAREQARKLLAQMGLADRALSRVTQLSGGEQQRVALARALASKPRALLLDEPFSALDADLRLRLRTEFARLIAAAGMACVLVTHDEVEARAMGQRGYRLVNGELQLLWTEGSLSGNA